MFRFGSVLHLLQSTRPSSHAVLVTLGGTAGMVEGYDCVRRSPSDHEVKLREELTRKLNLPVNTEKFQEVLALDFYKSFKAVKAKDLLDAPYWVRGKPNIRGEWYELPPVDSAYFRQARTAASVVFLVELLLTDPRRPILLVTGTDQADTSVLPTIHVLKFQSDLAPIIATGAETPLFLKTSAGSAAINPESDAIPNVGAAAQLICAGTRDDLWVWPPAAYDPWNFRKIDPIGRRVIEFDRTFRALHSRALGW